MPLYDYTCRKCSHTFEALVLGGRSPKACPECQSEEIERLISFPAVRSESTKETILFMKSFRFSSATSHLRPNKRDMRTKSGVNYWEIAYTRCNC